MTSFALGAVLALAACDGAQPANEAAGPAGNNAAASPAAPAGSEAPANASGMAVARRYEGAAVLAGFEAGDHLWAQFEPIPGREAESSALVETPELAAFLNAHRGRPLEVVIETVNRRLDPPGEQMDVTVLRSARAGGTSAEAWWQARTPEQRQDATREIEELMSAAGR